MPGRFSALDSVGPPFERRGKAAKGGVENASHEETQSPALEFVGNEEFHDARLRSGGMKAPAVFKLAERSIKVFDKDMQTGPVEGDTARESFMHEFVGNGHISNKNFDALRHGNSFAYLEEVAERHELGITLDIRDEIEHLGSRMIHRAFGRELLHQAISIRNDSLLRPRRSHCYPDRQEMRLPSRAALNRAKSSP